MSIHANDARYNSCGPAGQEELCVYLNWIQDVGLADTEYAFVAYALGRSGISDPRHLFMLWEHLSGPTVTSKLKLMTRRFFLQPSEEMPFTDANYAGWFDFLPSVYQCKSDVPSPDFSPPQFVKVGFSDMPIAHQKYHEIRPISSKAIPQVEDNSGNRLQGFITDISHIDFSNQSFIGNAIPSKKLNIALRSYCNDLSSNEVIFFLDTTVFGGAKEGLIISTKGLYAKDFGADPERVLFSNIATISYEKGKIVDTMLINGKKFMSSAGLNSNSFHLFFEKLQTFIFG